MNILRNWMVRKTQKLNKKKKMKKKRTMKKTKRNKSIVKNIHKNWITGWSIETFIIIWHAIIIQIHKLITINGIAVLYSSLIMPHKKMSLSKNTIKFQRSRGTNWKAWAFVSFNQNYEEKKISSLVCMPSNRLEMPTHGNCNCDWCRRRQNEVNKRA